jgi:hypothetical protein
MRTKALLLAAAVFAVGAGTSMAQVYSANAVGYVNMTLQPGFSLICNPLDNTNNGINTLFAGAPNQSRVYRFNADQTYTVATRLPTGTFNSNIVMNPGEGFFFQLPAAAAPLNITFVGEVPQGSLSNPLIPGGYQIRSSQVPQALPLGRPNSAAGVQTLNFPANVGDIVFRFNGTYTSFSYRQLGMNPAAWTGAGAVPDGPVINVGEGFFLFKAAGSPNAWTRTFSVN